MREGDAAEQRHAPSGERIDFDALREQILEAIRDGDEAALRDLARLAIAAFGRRGEGSGVLGVDVQRIRRALGLKSEPERPGQGRGRARASCRSRATRSAASRRILRRELERAQIERTQALPPSRPLNELDRALPSGPAQDLAAVHRVVMQLKRRLATQGHQARGHARHAHVDVRRTMRASLETGGVPVVLKYKPKRPRRPELYVLCDVSTSVTSASVFFLSVLHALHDSFRRMRSLRLRRAHLRGHRRLRRASAPSRPSTTRSPRTPASPTSPATPTTAASGASSCSRVEDDLHPRATVIVLGDARTNGRDPRADIFARIAEKAGRTFWLNPEPQALLELRRQRDQRLRAALRGLRVLDDAPARGLRQGAHPPAALNYPLTAVLRLLLDRHPRHARPRRARPRGEPRRLRPRRPEQRRRLRDDAVRRLLAARDRLGAARPRRRAASSPGPAALALRQARAAAR